MRNVMAKIRWYVQTDKVGSKMERDFDAEDFYDVRDDGTTELNERAVDEAVFEAMCQSVSYGWEIIDDVDAA
jgi:CO dehydrogenase/acetyl-CoA synthase beta subunit